MICNFICKESDLSLVHEVALVEDQYPDYQVLIVEDIPHKGNKVEIESRAILFAPVGNQSVFCDNSFQEIIVPKVAIIGFSTSVEAMNAFYKDYKGNNDFNKACVNSSFTGSKTLRKNIIRYASFLHLGKVIGPEFNPKVMFDLEQKDAYYTQIIKCCSIGKVNNKYSNTSAIYPNRVDQRVRAQYLATSSHRKCVENYFIKELKFSTKIPLVLIFKPGWDNLKAMGLLDSINANIINWIPHPSNPGSSVYKLLDNFESGKAIREENYSISAKQLITIRNRINETDF